MEDNSVFQRTIKPSHMKAAVAYIVALFLVSTFAAILSAMLVAKSKGLDVNLVRDSFFDATIVLTDEMKNAKLVGQGYGNFIAYLLAFLFVVFYERNHMIMDFQGLKENKKFFSIYIPITALAFMGIAYGIDVIFQKIAGDSNNQSSIVAMLSSEACIPMILSTVLFAPVVEELIYRKIVFSGLSRMSLVSAYIASILLFSLPHMLSGFENIGLWLLQLCPYILSAILLCVIYHKGKYNIYTSIAAHIMNNVLAVVLVFVWR